MAVKRPGTENVPPRKKERLLKSSVHFDNFLLRKRLKQLFPFISQPEFPKFVVEWCFINTTKVTNFAVKCKFIKRTPIEM